MLKCNTCQNSLFDPITVNQDNKILDGVHRWFAHKNSKKEDINAVVINTKDDDDVLLISTELNARHGYQLSNAEKKDRILTLYEKYLNPKEGEELSYDVERLKKCYSIPSSTFSRWTEKINQKLENIFLGKILDLYLQCKTQQEITEDLGLKSQSTVSDKISKIKQILEELSKNPKWEESIKYTTFTEKVEKLSNFVPQLYNIWNFAKNNNKTEHFGNVPVEVTENLLYYYTQPFDVVC